MITFAPFTCLQEFFTSHKLTIITILCTTSMMCSDSNKYFANRNLILQMEEIQSLGGSLILNEKELLVNQMIMRSKLKHKNYLDQISSKHFFHIRHMIVNSDIFNIIRKIPKGANLHGHYYGLASNEYLYNLTLVENLNVCDLNGKLSFNLKTDERCHWKRVEQLRRVNDTFDDYIKSQLDLAYSNYKNKNDVLNKFNDILDVVKSLIVTKSGFKDLLYEILKEHYEDNVMYLEIRSSLTLYDIQENKPYSPSEILNLCKEVISNFTNNHPGFFGAKFIYIPYASQPSSTYMQNVKTITNTYPDMVVGFDFQGNADDDVADTLRDLLSRTAMFQHSRINDDFDLNLADGVLLDSSRIQYTDRLMNHPLLLARIRHIGAGVDVCPISLQILSFENLQSLKYLIAQDFRVVVSNDYPGFWGAKGLSYDWYLMFVHVVDTKTDLKFLKQLAINSFVHSGLSDIDKNVAISEWQAHWDKFIEEMIQSQLMM